MHNVSCFSGIHFKHAMGEDHESFFKFKWFLRSFEMALFFRELATVLLILGHQHSYHLNVKLSYILHLDIVKILYLKGMESPIIKKARTEIYVNP